MLYHHLFIHITKTVNSFPPNNVFWIFNENESQLERACDLFYTILFYHGTSSLCNLERQGKKQHGLAWENLGIHRSNRLCSGLCCRIFCLGLDCQYTASERTWLGIVSTRDKCVDHYQLWICKSAPLPM